MVIFLGYLSNIFISLRWVACWQVRMFSPLWTVFWRKSVTSSNWSPPGLKIYLKRTVKEAPPLPPLRTHLLRAPLLPPPAPLPPATSTWRCSCPRRRRQSAVRRYPWRQTPHYVGERAGEHKQVWLKTDQGCLKKIKPAVQTLSIGRVLIMSWDLLPQASTKVRVNLMWDIKDKSSNLTLHICFQI